MHLTKIFYEVDEFCKQFEKQFEKKLLSDGQDKRNRAISMSLSEVMTVMIYFHDSGYKTFKGLAQKGKTSVGWFYGFKLHLVINHSGEITAFCITPGNIADNN